MTPAFQRRIVDGLRNSENVFHRWHNRTLVWVAWLGLLLAAVNPAHGFGITVCWFKLATGCSCPGCGLTRSLSCGLRGMLGESWNYHPFGLFILALFVATAVLSLLPATPRRRLAAWMAERALFFNTAYFAFVFLFLAFGAGRTLVEVAAHFPAL
jgi:Protein of unknown function (DUF2752)